MSSSDPRGSDQDPTQAEPGEDDAPIEVLEIEEHIDLHGFQPRDIPDVVEDYLEEALDRGFSEVRLIHGRCKGFQRKRVREILEAHPQVVAFRDAPATRGGWGATLVELRPRDPNSSE
jgi:dsDNA-specific endonuclease/ATPase MutS2